MPKNHKKSIQSKSIPTVILLTAKVLSFFSLKLASLYAARLFSSPLKHKIPKRELEMDTNSRQLNILIPTLQKNLVVYEYGDSPRKVLLSHGWSGRGTQLVKIADALLAAGYSTVSFDAPAHGKSPGTQTLMPEFIATILELQNLYGPFEAAVGHSLGGMSLLNAMRLGLKVKRLVIIGSGDIVEDIVDDFVAKMQMNPKIGQLVQKHFEQQFGETMHSYSAYLSAEKVDIPVLVIHDNDDDEVPAKAGIHIHKHLKHGQLMITKGLGHRKILGDVHVIEKVVEFIQN